MASTRSPRPSQSWSAAARSSKDGPANSDLTGGLALTARVVLIGVGLWIPFRHRGEGAQTPRRRWINRAIAVLGGFVVLYAGLYPPRSRSCRRTSTASRFPLRPLVKVRRVRCADCLQLSGWYAPSRNGAAVVLVHGGGGNRTGPLDHAQLLRRHGYGVLLYNSRGRGESDGTPDAWGWGWERDVEGALDFLNRRRDVDGRRIGASASRLEPTF